MLYERPPFYLLMRFMRTVLLFLLPALLLLGACQSDPSGSEGPAADSAEGPIPFRTDGTLTFLRDDEPLVTIDVEIADTDSARTRGLMQRTSLPERSGMLFLFDREEPQSFWMANTPLALDLFFADADSQIVTVAKYARPFSPSPVTSAAPARYVVEVPAGFADTYGITESDRIQWERRAP